MCGNWPHVPSYRLPTLNLTQTKGWGLKYEYLWKQKFHTGRSAFRLVYSQTIAPDYSQKIC